MVWFFGSSQHQKNVEFKRTQQRQRIEALAQYEKPLTSAEKSLLARSVESVVSDVSGRKVRPIEVLKAYGKAALLSHKRTNCLTEIMIKDAEVWAEKTNLSGPLAGFPVSLKDPFNVAGYDSTTGFSFLVDKPAREDGALVRLLRDAGALPYVKTNVPITMMAIEGENDLFGRTLNAWKPTHAPGGSSQGEGSLIASGGSRIGVGTDIGGSVRVPAAWSGIYALRFTSHRFPSDGRLADDGGFEGIQSVASPMAATLQDLKYFSDAVMELEPWKYDFKLVHQPWKRNVSLPEKPKVGVLRFNDYLPPMPAVERALSITADALKQRGYTVVDFELPDSPIDYESTISKIVHADNFHAVAGKFLPGENGEPSISILRGYTWWPKPLRRVFEFILNLLGFKEKAWRLRNLSPLSVAEYHNAVSRRQQLRRNLHNKWSSEKIDFLITPPHPSPALANYTGAESVLTVLYTVLWNFIDYPAGVIPVSRVDKTKDALAPSSDKGLNYPTKVTRKTYNAEEMDGLPLAVQIVTPRYYDEEALEAMRLVEEALHAAGIYYT